jgi:hypothetical protein
VGRRWGRARERDAGCRQGWGQTERGKYSNQCAGVRFAVLPPSGERWGHEVCHPRSAPRARASRSASGAPRGPGESPSQSAAQVTAARVESGAPHLKPVESADDGRGGRKRGSARSRRRCSRAEAWGVGVASLRHIRRREPSGGVEKDAWRGWSGAGVDVREARPRRRAWAGEGAGSADPAADPWGEAGEQRMRPSPSPYRMGNRPTAEARRHSGCTWPLAAINAVRRGQSRKRRGPHIGGPRRPCTSCC